MTLFSGFTTYRQLDSMDCGPTCLKMVLKHYGKRIGMDSLKKACQLGTSGVTLLGMSEAAEKYGLRTVSARLTFQQLLSEAPLPCILLWEQYHFVVLTPASTKKKIVIADPAKGELTYSTEEFLKFWININRQTESKGIAMLLTPRTTFTHQPDEVDNTVTWVSLLQYTLNYKKQLAQIFFGLMLASFLQLLLPFLTQSIVDTGLTTQDLTFIQMILIGQFAIFFGQAFIDFIRSRLLLFISTHINLSLLSDFWIKLMRLPLSYFDSKRTGDILQRVNDHKRIETFITGTGLQAVFSVFSMLIFSVVLFIYNIHVFLIFTAGSAVYFVWILAFLRFRRSIDKTRFTVNAKESSLTMQLVQGMHEIKLNNAEHLKRWEWESLQATLFKLNFRSLSLSQIQQAGALFINQGKNIVITYVVAKSVLDGQLTFGTMLAIQYIIGQLNSPVEQLISFSQSAQDAKMSLERLNEIHQVKNESSASSSSKVPENQNIIFNNVSFTYIGAGNLPILSSFNTIFERGKVTAIVGSSGSGKTTLIKLIQKFYDHYTGEIKIGDANLKHISPYQWRKASASVMQDAYIFSATIERNIALGDQYIDHQRLQRACRIANILDFINCLPLGFETRIGSEGNGISSGQRQRILIARAVYKSPEYILFDEATNALDANNEYSIMKNLQEFFFEKTVIIVAHRLSTVRNADRIIVMEQGQIIEEGKHDELVAHKGKYYELIHDQLELGQ